MGSLLRRFWEGRLPHLLLGNHANDSKRILDFDGYASPPSTKIRAQFIISQDSPEPRPL
jgi:hypothetical protein